MILVDVKSFSCETNSQNKLRKKGISLKIQTVSFDRPFIISTFEPGLIELII